MSYTNGHGPRRAILCARVSTDEQACSAYSLAQQIGADLYRATSRRLAPSVGQKASPK